MRVWSVIKRPNRSPVTKGKVENLKSHPILVPRYVFLGSLCEQGYGANRYWVYHPTRRRRSRISKRLLTRRRHNLPKLPTRHQRRRLPKLPTKDRHRRLPRPPTRHQCRSLLRLPTRHQRHSLPRRLLTRHRRGQRIPRRMPLPSHWRDFFLSTPNSNINLRDHLSPNSIVFARNMGGRGTSKMRAKHSNLQ